MNFYFKGTMLSGTSWVSSQDVCVCDTLKILHWFWLFYIGKNIKMP